MLAVIGGTGLYELEGLEITDRREVKTPFGSPSAPITCGEYQGKRILFLPRHGLDHQLLPGEINFRANIWALKSLGARAIVSVSASGSLRENVKPGELGLVSQYFDWTRGRRVGSFFGDGMVAHVSTAQPSCPILRRKIAEVANQADVSIHADLTYACVEGPRLGTRAESFFLRGAGCDLVGMTNVPEAFLALEAQLAYATIAIVTDYDCWLEDPTQHAATADILAFYRSNLGRIQRVLRGLFAADLDVSSSPSRQSLKQALVTSENRLTSDQKQLLALLRE
jgi:5'-methylthioadenosine phosphorylase